MTGGDFTGANRTPQADPKARPVVLTARDHAGGLLRVGHYRTRRDAATDAARWMARGDVGAVECIGGEAEPCIACGAYAPDHDDGCPVMTGEH